MLPNLLITKSLGVIYYIIFIILYKWEGRLEYSLNIERGSSTGLSDFKFHVLSSSRSCLRVFLWTLGPFIGDRVSAISCQGGCAAHFQRCHSYFVTCEHPFEHMDCSVDKVAWLCTKSLPGTFFSFLLDLVDFWRLWEALKGSSTELIWPNLCFRKLCCDLELSFRTRIQHQMNHWFNQPT